MALSATITWEVRYTGSDTNGGGFKTGASGTDYTLQDSPQLTVTDAACSGTTTVTSATGGFTSAMVGNVMYLSSGPGWYEITARTDTNTVTIDRAGPSASGMTCNVGGGFATPGRAAGVKVTSNRVFVKYNASSYTLTNTTINTSGGPVSDDTDGSAANPTQWIGYDTTRTPANTDANRPTISAGAQTNVTVFRVGAYYAQIHNIIVDGNSQTGTIGIDCQFAYGFVHNCKVLNCTSKGFFAGTTLIKCEATGCSGSYAGFYSNARCRYVACEAYANSCCGFSLTGDDAAVYCLSYNNTGSIGYGFASNSVGYTAINCVSYGNAKDGFDVNNSVANTRLVNCIAFNNSGAGFYAGSAKGAVGLYYCAGGSNVSGNYNSSNITFVEGFVNLGSNDPFNNAASGDFSLNNTAGAGALLRAAGFPGVMPRGTTTGYLDIGVAQHQDAGGTTVNIIKRPRRVM